MKFQHKFLYINYFFAHFPHMYTYFLQYTHHSFKVALLICHGIATDRVKYLSFWRLIRGKGLGISNQLLTEELHETTT
jgi:hypothetical protein